MYSELILICPFIVASGVRAAICHDEDTMNAKGSQHAILKHAIQCPNDT